MTRAQHFLQKCLHVRRRPVCASAQADQSLRCPPETALNPWLPTECLVNNEADLSLRCAHMYCCRKRCGPAHITIKCQELKETKPIKRITFKGMGYT